MYQLDKISPDVDDIGTSFLIEHLNIMSNAKKGH